MTANCRLLGLVLVFIGGSGCSRNPCPDGATQAGLEPPKGTRQWCQKLDADQSYQNHGRSTEWYANGQVKEQGDFANGNREGKWTRFHESGQKAWEGDYLHGEKVGRWLTWDEEGRKTGDVDFAAGAPPGTATEPPTAAPAPGLFGTGAPKPEGPDNDEDQDGIPDRQDCCPHDPNPLQEDLDQDKLGDACDDDLDGDKRDNVHDNCPQLANWEQEDTDHDSAGDACDGDLDGDNADNGADNCPKHLNPDQADTNRDGVGDACTPPPVFRRDMDGDGFQDPGPDDHPVCSPRNLKNCFDNCPGVANPDQKLRACQNEGDVDGDGVKNILDNCVQVPNPEQKATKGQVPSEGGDACFMDEDADGLEDIRDNCPLVRNPDQKSAGPGMPGEACLMRTPTTTP